MMLLQVVLEVLMPGFLLLIFLEVQHHTMDYVDPYLLAWCVGHAMLPPFHFLAIHGLPMSS